LEHEYTDDSSHVNNCHEFVKAVLNYCLTLLTILLEYVNIGYQEKGTFLH